jgi:hypothetical protein
VRTGGGHAGVINIRRYAQRLTGVDKLHAIIGGFHLTGPLFEPVIGDTVSALEQLAHEVVVPTHCTGSKATHAIARRLPGGSFRTASAPRSTSPLRPPRKITGMAALYKRALPAGADGGLTASRTPR